MIPVVSPIPLSCAGWQAGWMPAADAVLLPLCLGLTLLGLLVVVVAWRRGRRGRVLQGLALALAPAALYFSGLLRLVWDGVVAVVGWASRIVFSPQVWVGLSVLALCVVLWVVGGFVARRSPKPAGRRKAKAADAGSTPAALPRGGTSPRQAASGTSAPTTKAGNAGKAGPPVDEDMAEIEALLKSRGIS